MEKWTPEGTLYERKEMFHGKTSRKLEKKEGTGNLILKQVSKEQKLGEGFRLKERGANTVSNSMSKSRSRTTSKGFKGGWENGGKGGGPISWKQPGEGRSTKKNREVVSLGGEVFPDGKIERVGTGRVPPVRS